MENLTNLTPDQATAQLEQMTLIARRNALARELFATSAQLQSKPRVDVQPVKPSKPETPKSKVVTSPSGDKERVIKKNVEPKPTPKPKANPAKLSVAKKTEESVDQKEVGERIQKIEGVHLDVYDYFTIPPMSTDREAVRRLQYISSWVEANGKTTADGLKKLHSIDLKLGSSDTGETKLTKLYNWIRFSGKK